MAIIFGMLLVAAGSALLLDVGGAGTLLIERVTSRNLGNLAPGYAASKAGFRVYSSLVLALGVICCGIGLATWTPGPGLLMAGLGVGLRGGLGHRHPRRDQSFQSLACRSGLTTPAPLVSPFRIQELRTL